VGFSRSLSFSFSLPVHLSWFNNKIDHLVVIVLKFKTNCPIFCFDYFNHLICPFFINDSWAFILFSALCVCVSECVSVCTCVCVCVFIYPPLKTPNSVMPWPEQQQKKKKKKKKEKEVAQKRPFIFRLQKQNKTNFFVLNNNRKSYLIFISRLSLSVSLFLCFSVSPFNTCSYVMISPRAKIVAMDEKLETKSFDSFSLMRWIIADFPLFCPSLSGEIECLSVPRKTTTTHTLTHTHTHTQTHKLQNICPLILFSYMINSIQLALTGIFSVVVVVGRRRRSGRGRTRQFFFFLEKNQSAHTARELCIDLSRRNDKYFQCLFPFFAFNWLIIRFHLLFLNINHQKEN